MSTKSDTVITCLPPCPDEPRTNRCHYRPVTYQSRLPRAYQNSTYPAQEAYRSATDNISACLLCYLQPLSNCRQSLIEIKQDLMRNHRKIMLDSITDRQISLPTTFRGHSVMVGKLALTICTGLSKIADRQEGKSSPIRY